eukprot:scaffold368805_cov42-Prasinocladus_malaysianus.AAC.1
MPFFEARWRAVSLPSLQFTLDRVDFSSRLTSSRFPARTAMCNGFSSAALLPGLSARLSMAA